MSATAQNYVYRVKITDEKAMQDKPSISREELERIKREVAQYLVRPGERKISFSINQCNLFFLNFMLLSLLYTYAPRRTVKSSGSVVC